MLRMLVFGGEAVFRVYFLVSCLMLILAVLPLA